MNINDVSLLIIYLFFFKKKGRQNSDVYNLFKFQCYENRCKIITWIYQMVKSLIDLVETNSLVTPIFF
jgi:hypothetical protein